jgi:hypothetical protein
VDRESSVTDPVEVAFRAMEMVREVYPVLDGIGRLDTPHPVKELLRRAQRRQGVGRPVGAPVRAVDLKKDRRQAIAAVAAWIVEQRSLSHEPKKVLHYKALKQFPGLKQREFNDAFKVLGNRRGRPRNPPS